MSAKVGIHEIEIAPTSVSTFPCGRRVAGLSSSATGSGNELSGATKRLRRGFGTAIFGVSCDFQGFHILSALIREFSVLAPGRRQSMINQRTESWAFYVLEHAPIRASSAKLPKSRSRKFGFRNNELTWSSV